jgi:hypothetical protein
MSNAISSKDIVSSKKICIDKKSSLDDINPLIGEDSLIANPDSHSRLDGIFPLNLLLDKSNIYNLVRFVMH